MDQGKTRWIAAATVAVIVAGVAVLFVGCGPMGFDVKPVTVNATAHVDQPVEIKGEVPIVLKGPIVVQLQGPSVEYTGTYVSDALMERVQLGSTTSEWIRAVIGEPDSTAKMADGSEIWKWVYRPKGSQFMLLSLPGQEKQSPTPQPITAYVRVKDDVVVDKWRG